MDPLEIIKRDKKKWDKQLELVEKQLAKIKDVLPPKQEPYFLVLVKTMLV